MDLIPRELGDWLDERLAGRVVHLEVNGVPIVGVPVAALIADLDEPFDPRVTDLIVED